MIQGLEGFAGFSKILGNHLNLFMTAVLRRSFQRILASILDKKICFRVQGFKVNRLAKCVHVDKRVHAYRTCPEELH